MSAASGVWAVVPVKPFAHAKQRLAPAYGPSFRASLARAMLEDVLAALAALGDLGGVLVATRDPAAAGTARAFGADIRSEAVDGGLNAAVTGCARHLARLGARTMLVLPADIPAATTDELSRLLSEHGNGRAISIVPSRDGGGTNALVTTPPDAIPFAWGERSRPAHVRAARSVGIEPRVLGLPGLGLDIDTPDDLAAFARHARAGRTRDFLQEHGLIAPPTAARA